MCVWLRQKHFNLAQFCHRRVLGNSVMEEGVTKEHGGCMRARKPEGLGRMTLTCRQAEVFAHQSLCVCMSLRKRVFVCTCPHYHQLRDSLTAGLSLYMTFFDDHSP